MKENDEKLGTPAPSKRRGSPNSIEAWLLTQCVGGVWSVDSEKLYAMLWIAGFHKWEWSEMTTSKHIRIDRSNVGNNVYIQAKEEEKL